MGAQGVHTEFTPDEDLTETLSVECVGKRGKERLTTRLRLVVIPVFNSNDTCRS